MAGQFGPRITGLRLAGGTNVFAELGDLSIHLPDGRRYRLAGGHRLWTAPEVPEITYAPDDRPVVVTDGESGFRITQSPDPATGIEKSIAIHLQMETVHLIHRITNGGGVARALAPWAITQLPVGGTTLLPLSEQFTDEHGLQPNAEIVLWPYTGIDDTPFVFHERILLIGSDRATPTKIGTSLERGWMSYVRDGLVFTKYARPSPDGRYLDRGAAAQCYSGPDFVELETLGPVATLQPGESTEHEELWKVDAIDPGIPPFQVPDLLDLDGGHPQ